MESRDQPMRSLILMAMAFVLLCIFFAMFLYLLF